MNKFCVVRQLLCHSHYTLRQKYLCCKTGTGSDKMSRHSGVMSLNLNRKIMILDIMIIGEQNSMDVVIQGEYFESEIQKAEEKLLNHQSRTSEAGEGEPDENNVLKLREGTFNSEVTNRAEANYQTLENIAQFWQLEYQ